MYKLGFSKEILIPLGQDQAMAVLNQRSLIQNYKQNVVNSHPGYNQLGHSNLCFKEDGTQINLQTLNFSKHVHYYTSTPYHQHSWMQKGYAPVKMVNIETSTLIGCIVTFIKTYMKSYSFSRADQEFYVQILLASKDSKTTLPFKVCFCNLYVQFLEKNKQV